MPIVNRFLTYAAQNLGTFHSGIGHKFEPRFDNILLLVESEHAIFYETHYTFVNKNEKTMRVFLVYRKESSQYRTFCGIETIPRTRILSPLESVDHKIIALGFESRANFAEQMGVNRMTFANAFNRMGVSRRNLRADAQNIKIYLGVESLGIPMHRFGYVWLGQQQKLAPAHTKLSVRDCNLYGYKIGSQTTDTGVAEPKLKHVRKGN